MTMQDNDTLVAGIGASKTFTEFARFDSTSKPCLTVATNSVHSTLMLSLYNTSDVMASFKLQGSVSDPINRESSIGVPASAGGGSDQVTLFLAGSLVDESMFGFWSPTESKSVTGMQISAQDVPTGSAAIFEVYVNGVATGRTGTLADGSATAEVTFGSALPVVAGDDVTVVVKQIGSTASGAFVTIMLICGGGSGSPNVVKWTNVTGSFDASFEDIDTLDVVAGGRKTIEVSSAYRYVRILPTVANFASLRVGGFSSSATMIL